MTDSIDFVTNVTSPIGDLQTNLEERSLYTLDIIRLPSNQTVATDTFTASRYRVSCS
jgi:hypothetical protein